MYLLIELFSTLMAHLGSEAAPAAKTAMTGAGHIEADAILS